MSRYRGWVTLRLSTWNIGGAKKPPRILPDAIALQEAGDQYGNRGMVNVLRANGYRLVTGTAAGQSSTPLAYDPKTLDLLRPKRYLLAARQYAGPGAGPSMLKQKWLIGGKFEHRATGRRMWIFSVHYVATQGKPRRRTIAKAMTARIVTLVRSVARPVFVLGDYNGHPDGPVLGALRRAGLLVNHLVGRPFGTHGRRAIDQAWWTPRPWFAFIGHRDIKSQSDHDLVLVEFVVKPKKENR